MIRAVIFDYGWVLRKVSVQQDLVDYAASLREKGIKTAVLSNMIRPVAFIFRHSPELKKFSPVIISCDVGLAKPDPRIYQMMLEQLNTPAEQCVFIDNREDNLEAAAKLGIHTIKSHNTQQIINDINKLF